MSPVVPSPGQPSAVIKYSLQSAFGDGWVVFGSGSEAGRQQYVDPACRTALVNAGIVEVALVDYTSEIGETPTVQTWRLCDELLAFIGGAGNSSGAHRWPMSILSFAEGQQGWVVFSAGSEAGNQQWVDAACVRDLTSAGVAIDLIEDYSSQIGGLATVDRWRACPELLAL